MHELEPLLGSEARLLWKGEPPLLHQHTNIAELLHVVKARQTSYHPLDTEPLQGLEVKVPEVLVPLPRLIVPTSSKAEGLCYPLQWGERAVEKLFWCIPEKYKQITRSIESLLDLSMMSIEEAIGSLKVVDGDKPQPVSGPITIGGKLHLTREHWEACQSDGKKGESPPSTGGRKRGKRHKMRRGAQAGAQGHAEGSTRGGAPGCATGNQKPAWDGACHNCGKLGYWAKECRQPRCGQAHVA
jgi:hypothetical protein